MTDRRWVRRVSISHPLRSHIDVDPLSTYSSTHSKTLPGRKRGEVEVDATTSVRRRDHFGATTRPLRRVSISCRRRDGVRRCVVEVVASRSTSPSSPQGGGSQLWGKMGEPRCTRASSSTRPASSLGGSLKSCRETTRSVEPQAKIANPSHSVRRISIEPPVQTVDTSHGVRCLLIEPSGGLRYISRSEMWISLTTWPRLAPAPRCG